MTRMGPRSAALIACLLALAACGGSGTPTEAGITSNSILLGVTIAQSGPAAAYGTIANAANAYFTYINGQGGVNGRKITYKIVDDGYNPAQTVPLTKQLVEKDQVFAMFGGLGTQTQTSVRDYLNSKKVPQLFVATGATTFMGDFSQHPDTIGWQPPYQGEARIYAKDVLANHPNAKIGVLYQNDDYGLDYLKGLTDGLADKASMIVDKESYDVTAAVPTLATQLTKLKAKGADTLFIFATPAFTIGSLAIVTAIGWAPLTYLNSVSNPAAYMQIAASKGAKIDGVISVGYIKDPTDPQWANDDGMKLYQTVIANCSTCKPNDGFNIYGVAVAYTMVDVLRQAGSNLTRDNVMSIAGSGLNETNPFLLPGVKVTTSSSDHYPITQEQVIKWSANAWHLQGNLIDEQVS
ncbi:MAG: branched-chain amino acid transport system substrate-binding protein [Chloroflexota bacterium]|nr:branched-chain amino acid transport system substrate-binding protein [Chloroflexota bacterium]